MKEIETVSFKKRRISRFLRPCKFLFALPMTLFLAMLFPQPAHAGIFEAIADFDGWLKGILCDMGITLWNVYFGIVGDISSSTVITGNFTNLFDSAGVWNIVKTTHQTFVIPVGESILALFMLVQLVKISQRIDATATLPAVKDIVFLAVTYVLIHWLIVNSLDIVTDVYGVFNDIAKSIVGSEAIANSSLSKDAWDVDKATIGGCFLFIVTGFFSMFVGTIAYLVALVVALARGVQLYAMAVFAPIPLSLLGFDETRQMGIGFLKNFCAAALAGAIIIFLIVVYPYMVSATGGDPTASDNIFSLTYEDNFLDTISVVLGYLSLSVMLIFGLTKSGAWAKEILGS